MSNSSAQVATKPACTMKFSASPAEESGYATDKSFGATSTTWNDHFNGTLEPVLQMDSTKCFSNNGLPEYSDIGKPDDLANGHLNNTDKKSPGGGTKYVSLSESCSPSVSIPSISDLNGSCSFSSSQPEFSGTSLLLLDSPVQCPRVTSTPFGRGTVFGPRIDQIRNIRQSYPLLHYAESPHFSNASQPNSPKIRPREGRNSSSLSSFTSDYFSNGSIATLSEPLNTPRGGLFDSSKSISCSKTSKPTALSSPWMQSVRHEETNPVQPLNLSCQSLPSDSEQHFKKLRLPAIPPDECLAIQEISADSGHHSTFVSSNNSHSITTIEPQNYSWPVGQTDRAQIAQEQSPQLRRDLEWKGEILKDAERGRTTKVNNFDHPSKIVPGSLALTDTKSKSDLEMEVVQLDPILLLDGPSSSLPTPPVSGLLRSLSSPNLISQMSAKEDKPFFCTNTSAGELQANLFDFSSAPLLPSLGSGGMNECKRFSHSSFEIQNSLQLADFGSVLNNSDVLSPKFLSTPILSPFKEAVDHSPQEYKISKTKRKVSSSVIYQEDSINSLSKPPIPIQTVTKPPIPFESGTKKSPKHISAATDSASKSVAHVDSAVNILRTDADCNHAPTASNLHKLCSISIDLSKDSLILPCPDNCINYPAPQSPGDDSIKRPLKVADAKRNLCLTNLEFDEEYCKTTSLEKPIASKFSNRLKCADTNGSASPPLLGECLSPCSKQSESYSPYGNQQLPLTKKQIDNLPTPPTSSQSYLPNKPPIYPSTSSFVHLRSSCTDRKLWLEHKQSDRDEASLECKDILTFKQRPSAPSIGGTERDCLAHGRHTLQTKKIGQKVVNQTSSHGKLQSESISKVTPSSLPSCEHKPQQVPHRFCFLPLVTASAGERQCSRNVLTLMMEEAPYLLSAVLSHLCARDLVAVTRANKQLRAVVMETTRLRSKITMLKRAHGQTVRILGKENISCLGKSIHQTGAGPRTALHQLNNLPSTRSTSSILTPDDYPPPRVRPQPAPQPTFTGKKETKKSPRKILGAIQYAVSSLQAAVSPSKASTRPTAVRALKSSKKLFGSGSSALPHRNSLLCKGSTKSPASLPCHCSQCQAASHRDRSCGAASPTTAKFPCVGQVAGASQDGSDKALEGTGSGAGRRSRTGGGNHCGSRFSINTSLTATDNSPTKFSPIKLNAFAKSTIKRLRRL